MSFTNALEAKERKIMKTEGELAALHNSVITFDKQYALHKQEESEHAALYRTWLDTEYKSYSILVENIRKKHRKSKKEWRSMDYDAKKAHWNFVDSEVYMIEKPVYTPPQKNHHICLVYDEYQKNEHTKKMLNRLREIIVEVGKYGDYSTGWISDDDLNSTKDKDKLPDTDIAGYLRGLGYTVFHKIRAREYEKTDDSSTDSDEDSTYYQRKLKVTIN